MIDPDHPLAKAARMNDDAARTTKNDIEKVVESLGMDFEALKHVAEQRALRAVLIQGERELPLMAPAGVEETSIHLEPYEVALLGIYTTFYLDAIAIGWRARGIAAG